MAAVASKDVVVHLKGIGLANGAGLLADAEVGWSTMVASIPL